MLSFILAFILLALFFAALVFFPYKKVSENLKKYIHFRTFFGGIVLILLGYIFDKGSVPVPSTKDLSEIIPHYAAGIHLIMIVAGFLCFVASFFINRFFRDND